MMVMYAGGRMQPLPDLSGFTGFDWDDGNLTKNWQKQDVACEECEQVFFNAPLLLFEDREHSELEARYYVLGKTDAGRRLFLVFTPRGSRIRVISARDMSEQERRRYR
jgi:uncharacterized protein